MTLYSPTPGHDEWQLSQLVETIRLHAERKPEEVDWEAVADEASKLDRMLREYGVRRAA